MEADDWQFSEEELESLERNAISRIAQQNSSSSASASASLTSTAASSQFTPAKSYDRPLPHLTSTPTPSPAKPVSSSRPDDKVCTLPTASGKPPADATLNFTGDDSTKPQLKTSIKFSIHASGNIAAKFVYDQQIVAAFRKIPKATWNAKERLWMFPLSSLSSAEQILCKLHGSNIEIETLDPLVQRAIAASLTVPDLRDRYGLMPNAIESKLLPFQREGVRFALQHGGRVLLADEMGLGKTLQAIAVASCVRDSWPVLVLTPSSLRLQWASMIQQWLNIPSSDIVVVIADESHFLKNAQAKRTSASLPILQKAQYTMLLSGTPALSRPIELFKQLDALYPHVYKNVHEYGNRYCLGGTFGLYQGARNHEELHNLMKATVMIRRLKKDVLSELPVKRRQQLEVVKGKIKASRSKEEAESLKFTEKNLINKIYTDSAEAKIPAVLDYLGTIIEAGCKFIVFAHHQQMIDSIHQYLLKKKVGCIRIDGGTPAGSRQSLVTDFQEKDAIRAAVLSIKAGGVGLTLTAASTVIFAELSWTPGDIIQAEDRAHRIGQVSSVNVYYLLANDTVDDIIWDVIQSKLGNLGQMLDGHENSLEVSANHPTSSPAKQKTLDSFLKRCNTLSSEHESKHKLPRQ